MDLFPKAFKPHGASGFIKIPSVHFWVRNSDQIWTTNFQNSCFSWFFLNCWTMLVLNRAKQKDIQDILAASKSQAQVVIMKGKQTPPWMGSLVRDGRRDNHMITVSLDWEIITFVGILIMGILGCGASPVIQMLSGNTAQFHSVPLWRLSTSHLTMMGNLTRIIFTHMPLSKKKTFLARSQSALVLWWRPGMNTQMRSSLFSVIKIERSGTGFRSLSLCLTLNSHSNLKIQHRMYTRAKSCSTHCSGPGFASPKTPPLL